MPFRHPSCAEPMVRRWLLYLAALLGCVVFLVAYQQWFALFALVCVLCLPVLSLLVSLPAMLTSRMEIRCADSLGIGDGDVLVVSVSGKLPVPPYRCPVRVTRMTTGESWRLNSGAKLPTEHCGQLLCKPISPAVYDYLGLFRLPMRKMEEKRVLVRPNPQKVEPLPALEQYLARSWRPKPGGGYAENHELRLYRPGDSLNQIHWKLSAKTGNYIIRESMIPQRGNVLLTMELQGSPEELDRKFGQLQWLSGYLLEHEMSHEIRVFTGIGMAVFPIVNEADCLHAVDALLGMLCARENAQPFAQVKSSWHYHIGGGSDEA